MNNDIFQKVFDILQPILPAEWKKLVLYVGYTSGSYSMKYYTCDDKGNYIDCFSQQGISKAQLIKIFMGIDKELSTERKLLEGKNRWNVMTMLVDCEGKMKTEYDYSDISENAIAYEQKWKEKYINKNIFKKNDGK